MNPASQSQPYLYNLSALRGIAAVLVVVLHFDFMMGAVIPRGVTGILDKLYLMVDLFFVLSGFVMCYVYAKQFEVNVARRDYKRFLWVRFARIYPLHFVTLLAEIVLFLAYVAFDKFDLLPGHSQYMFRVDAIPTNLLFLQTIGIHDFVTWNTPSWSLSAEWWAYVLFPVLFVLSVRYKLFAWIVIPVLALGGWLLCEFYFAAKEPFMSHPANPENRTLNVIWHYGTLRGIFGFAAGMFVYQLYRIGFLKKFLGKWLLALTCMALVWLHFRQLDTVSVVLFSLIILSAAYGSPTTDRILQTSALQKLGDWSFSIYLWHLVIFKTVDAYFVFQRTEQVKGILRIFEGNYLKAIVAMFVSLAVVIFVARLSYEYIEKPSRLYLRRFFKN